MGCELTCDLGSHRRLDATRHVDRRQLPHLVIEKVFRFEALLGQVCRLGVGLKTDGHVLTSRHRHGTGG